MYFLSAIKDNRNLLVVLIIFVVVIQYSNIGIIQESFKTETKHSNLNDPPKNIDIDNDIPQREFKKWEWDFPCFVGDEANVNSNGGKCICATWGIPILQYPLQYCS